MEKEWAGQNLALGGEICVSIHTRLYAVRADTSNTSNTSFLVFMAIVAPRYSKLCVILSYDNGGPAFSKPVIKIQQIDGQLGKSHLEYIAQRNINQYGNAFQTDMLF